MYPVVKYCDLFKASGKTPMEFALYMRVHSKELCLSVMELIGSWPNSEPELNALQQVWP